MRSACASSPCSKQAAPQLLEGTLVERFLRRRPASSALERVDQLLGALVALLRILGERALHDLVERGRHPALARVRGGRSGLDRQVLRDHVDRRGALERRAAGQRLVHERAHLVQVAARVERQAARLLGRDRLGRTEHRQETGGGGAERDAREQPVGGGVDQDAGRLARGVVLAGAHDEHVFGLHVAVHEATLVQRRQAAQHAGEDRFRLVEVQAAGALDALGERLAGHVLRRHPRARVLELAYAEDRYEAGRL